MDLNNVMRFGRHNRTFVITIGVLAQILEFWRNLCCHNSTIYLEIQGVPVALKEILMYLIHKELCWKTWELPWTYSIRFMNRPNLQLLVIIIVVSFWLCWELFIDPNEIQCQFTKIIINCFHNHYHPKDFLFFLYFNIKLWCGSCNRDLHNIYEAMWLRQSHRSHNMVEPVRETRGNNCLVEKIVCALQNYHHKH